MVDVLPNVVGDTGSVEATPIMPVGAFDVAVVPATAAGAYSAGDIMGALLEFAGVAQFAGQAVMITGVQVASKVAVNPALTLILFNADPSATTKTDNAAYSLNAADVFKVIAAVPLVSFYDHGTPNTWRTDGLAIVAKPVGTSLYGLLIDNTGVTLASATDLQVRVRGVAA